uniref:Uncharacterized protein n=1 Tax=Anguilla anguilla TaxID=7936 RepID=A0A0E9UE36_ANGAN
MHPCTQVYKWRA